MPKRKIKIVEKKLGREKVWGFCYFDKNRIEIDQTLKGKKRLKVLTHELLHRAFGKDMPEYKVLKAERIIGEGLWEQNYRRVDQ